MAERRSLAAAIKPQPDIDPNQMKAFVTQEGTHERPVTLPTSATVAPQEKREEKSPETTTLRSRAKKKSSKLQPVGLIPVTVRLKPEIAGALKRASLERQLEGEELFSQQDMVEASLEPWLREHGYL